MSFNIEIDDLIYDRYLVKDFIGQGGMQLVFLCYDEVLQKDVALKTPKVESATKRFHRSAIVSSKINHPNVAKTLDYFKFQDKQFLVEEYVFGGDLEKEVIDQVSCVDPFLVAKVFRNISKGLAASHHAGVVHRDLKPSNIVISGGLSLSEIKITDFGIAKMAEEELNEAAEGGASTLSASATAVGALPYMAPEAIETPKDVTVAADIWSLGAMMFELLTGTKPFGEGLKAVRNILEVNITEIPRFVIQNKQFSHLSKQLIELSLDCLKLNPLDRPTADDLTLECSKLCYPTNCRNTGKVKSFHFNSWGFIETGSDDVFFHKDCVYGDMPNIGDKVMYSSHQGGGADRALPVVKLV